VAVTVIRPAPGAPPRSWREAAALDRRAARLPSWQLTRRQRADLELLACGGFAPLRGFLGQDDYTRVCESMRLTDGTLWPIPVTLDLPEKLATMVPPGRSLALRDDDETLLAVLHVTESWRPDRSAEAEAVFGTADPGHAGARYLLQQVHPRYVTGELDVVRPPRRPTFPPIRHTPAELRAEFARRSWSRVVAFQTRNPMHRVHLELTLRASRQADAHVLLHPVVGPTKPGDVDHATRVRCYQAILPYYPPGRVMLSLLPLAMRMAGPREALWHAIIRRNYGATHFIVGRDHAGPGGGIGGRPFYEPYAAQELLKQHAGEIGIEVMTFRRLVYLPDHGTYLPEDEVPPGVTAFSISGTELRERLAEGRTLPAWFTPPEIAAELRRASPPDGAAGGSAATGGGASDGARAGLEPDGGAPGRLGRLRRRNRRPSLRLSGPDPARLRPPSLEPERHRD
jgi:sulfate adenylyltransferase